MDMPVLKPIPIPTKGVGVFRRLWRWFTSVRRWEIQVDYMFPMNGVDVIIPKGFVFDGASIPRLLWSVLAPTGLLFIPGLIHDFAYRYDYLWTRSPATGGLVKFKPHSGRLFWDNCFFRVAKAVNGIHFMNTATRIALITCGWWAWNANRKRNAPELFPGM